MGIKEYFVDRFLRESIETSVQTKVSERVQEMAYEITGDPDADSTLYRRLTAAERDLSPVVHDRMLDIAYYLWLTNPAAKDVIEKYVDFVVGEGITITADNPDVQSVIDAFMEDNNREDGFEGDVRDLGLYGELIFPVAVNEADGFVDLGYIDPKEVKSVNYSKDNRLKAESITLKGTPAREERTLKVIDKDRDPESPTLGMLVGEVFYFSINRPRNVSRGVSDLLCIADWLDAYDQFLFNFVEGSGFKNAWIYDVTLEGMNDKEIQDYARKQKPPKPGTIKYHNEKVKWETCSPELKAKDNTDAARLIRSMVHWGSGIPEHWAGFGDFANRATAGEMAEPPIKRLTRRQNYIKTIIRKVIRFVIDQAAIAQKIKGVPADAAERRDLLSFKVNMPEMSAKDTGKIAQALSAATQSLVLAVQQGWLRDSTATRVYATMASQLGADIDSDEEIAELEKQKEEEDSTPSINDEKVRKALETDANTEGSEEE